MSLPESKRFQQIKEYHLKKGTLFEDPEFPTELQSIDCKNPGKYAHYDIKWMRPGELFKEPVMFKDGVTRLDICQGMLGDCWFLASMASLTLDQGLFNQVVPRDQGFQKGEYCGAFRFCFWRFGEWVEVIIDDRLPTYRGKLMYVHSAENGEMWSSLMEKAYAKLFKSYVYLKGGQMGEALTDFTGGISEDIDLKKAPNNLYKKLQKAYSRKFLMGCAINAKPNEIEAKANCGLVKGHAYSVTSIATVKTRDTEHQLIRVRNPWGNEREWTGAWGDQSDEWRQVSDTEKEQLGLTFDSDGEFWMSFEDFCKEFDRLTICHNAGTDLDATMDLTMSGRAGSWVKTVSAGGCRNFLNTFASNPQYKVVLKETDNDDDDNCSLIVALMQKKSRGFSDPALTIGFAIYTLPDNPEEFLEDGLLTRDFFAYHASTARSATFINAREIVNTFELPPGTYILVPSTFEPNYKGDFFMRLLTEKPTNETTELTGETSVGDKNTRADSHSDYENEDDEMIKKLKPTFEALAGTDDYISVKELLSLIGMLGKSISHEEPDYSQAYTVMAQFDKDYTGSMDFNEFLKFYRYYMDCRSTFGKYSDKQGRMSAQSLNGALRKMDIRLSRPLISAALMRYGDHGQDVTFCNFMALTSKVLAVVDTCKKDKTCTSQSMDNFLMVALRM